MLSDVQRQFLEASRVAHLATADANGVPHVVPVCFGLIDNNLYITVDEKPKRQDRPLKRIRNILDNPAVAVTVDRWDEDWTRLAWIMLHGTAEVLQGSTEHPEDEQAEDEQAEDEHTGDEHAAAQAMLRIRYPQYQSMSLTRLPVIALRIRRVLAWGTLRQD